MTFESLLVPVDFSANSARALEFAATLAKPNGEIYVLHVIDADFVERLAQEGYAETDAAIERLRRSAEQRLQELLAGWPKGGGALESMVVVGKPFAEILRIAADLEFQAIVMAIRGRHAARVEELLFGSTAEKVLRGARIPVICVPGTADPR
jgi:nucleotide-binding universal stress UspA family protein